MTYQNLENEIFTKVKSLNGHQKFNVLDYIENIPAGNHNTRLYRRRAMKQIREALRNQA
ncbi:MAG: hypothetical protein KI790_06540 [Cyclobacteriaceae bacterium]|nr:hypothetical protein [Cyclobacteriaceae bacterium HetDA_MAG_MS6]